MARKLFLGVLTKPNFPIFYPGWPKMDNTKLSCWSVYQSKIKNPFQIHYFNSVWL